MRRATARYCLPSLIGVADMDMNQHLDYEINQLHQSQPGSDAMIMSGPWFEAIPAKMITHDAASDPYHIIGPNERAVFGACWMALRETGARPGTIAPMPDNNRISATAGISHGQLVKSMGILRMTRWFSAYDSSASLSGRFAGRAYILSPEPIPLSEILLIDKTYISFVQVLIWI